MTRYAESTKVDGKFYKDPRSDFGFGSHWPPLPEQGYEIMQVIPEAPYQGGGLFGTDSPRRAQKVIWVKHEPNTGRCPACGVSP